MIDRLLGMPVTAPLKAMLTGVELLLGNAQVWEETAARHVSMAPQLVPLSALATRWRRLELAAWKGLLDGTRQRMAAAAHQVGHWVLAACLNAQPSGRCRKCDAGAPLKAQHLSCVLLHCRRGSTCTASC